MKPDTNEPVIEESELPAGQQGAPEMAETAYAQSTQCEHHLVWESRDIAVCNNGCGHGCSLNPDFFDLKDGKIVEKSTK